MASPFLRKRRAPLWSADLKRSAGISKACRRLQKNELILYQKGELEKIWKRLELK